MSPETLYRAAFVLPVTSPPIRDGFVAVRDGAVTRLGPIGERPALGDKAEIDLGPTILMPGLVNAHTHLELSHLKGLVSGDRGFVPWIEDQLRVRAEASLTGAETAIGRAVEALEAAGTAAVADVSNSLGSVDALMRSELHALVLHEILGFDASKAEAIHDATKAARALAGERLRANPSTGSSRPPGTDGAAAASRVRIETAAHAPHSISPELFRRLTEDGGVRSIHVAESKSEDEFLHHGGGEWKNFLNRRVGSVPFRAPGMSPVRYLDDLGVLTPGLLAVHCVRVSEDDAKILARREVVSVLCPRSNAFLGNGVPPLAMLLGQGVPLALGTDSLASCDSLDVIEDARLLARTFPRVPKPVLLHALTRGGATALGFPNLGEIRPGSLARFAAFSFGGAAPTDPTAFILGEATAPRTVA